MNRTRASKTNRTLWYNASDMILGRALPSFVHKYDTQQYYNSVSGETSFPFSSVRTTNAMQFDAEGNLIWAPANMISNSTMAGAVVGVIGSGGVLPTNWAMTAGAGMTREIISVTSGYIDMRVYGTNSSGTSVNTHMFFEPYMTAVADTPYTFSIYTQIIAGSLSGFSANAGRIFVREALSGVTVIDTTTTENATGQYTRKSLSFVVQSSGVNQMRPAFNIIVPDGGVVDVTFRLGGMQFEPTDSKSPKRYYPTSGTAYYGPRFDYDPVTHGPLGFLIESSRTNDLTQGFNLDGTFGTFQAGTGTAGPSYIGGWPSARYTGDGTNTGHFFYTGSVTPPLSTSRSVSAIVAYVNTQYLQLTSSTNWPVDGVNTYMNIDAIAGTITATGSAVTDTFIKKLADNVYHIGYTCVTSAAPTSGAAAIICAANSPTATRITSFTHTGSFDVIYLQNSDGTGWNSIIPTFSSAVSRADDVVSMSTGSWLNTAAGTIYAEAKRITSSGSAQTLTNIGNSGGTTERNQFRINAGNTSHIIAVGGAVQATSAVGSTSPSNVNVKLAYRYQVGDQELFEDGSIGASSGNIASLPATQDTIHIGQLAASSEKFNGWIKQVRYYASSSASDAEIQTLTT